MDTFLLFAIAIIFGAFFARLRDIGKDPIYNWLKKRKR